MKMNVVEDRSDVTNQRRERRLTLDRTLWALQILLGFYFSGSGFGKVLLYDGDLYAQAPRAVSWFAAVPQPLIVFIGVCELLGGVGVILPALARVKPKLTPLAAAGLAVTMVLATGFHLVRGEYALLPAPVVLGGVAAFVAVGRSSRRPVAPAPLTARSVLVSLAVVVAMLLTTILPTWYTMTHARF
jgi:uncharacterized membrane protein YphA (DoxX/SURF4 family)